MIIECDRQFSYIATHLPSMYNKLGQLIINYTQCIDASYQTAPLAHMICVRYLTSIKDEINIRIMEESAIASLIIAECISNDSISEDQAFEQMGSKYKYSRLSVIVHQILYVLDGDVILPTSIAFSNNLMSIDCRFTNQQKLQIHHVLCAIVGYPNILVFKQYELAIAVMLMIHNKERFILAGCYKTDDYKLLMNEIARILTVIPIPSSLTGIKPFMEHYKYQPNIPELIPSYHKVFIQPRFKESLPNNISALKSTNINTIYSGVINGQLVAIKSNKVLCSAILEIAIMKSYLHPNIQTIHSFYMNNDKIMICTPMMETDLENLINVNISDNTWTEVYHKMTIRPINKIHMNIRRNIAKGLISGLEYLRSRGIIHRDLKPSNILLTSQLQPIISDFGLSRVLIADDCDVSNSLYGTPAYSAPGDQISMSSDIWSLGVILLELEMVTLTTNFNTLKEIHNAISHITNRNNLEMVTDIHLRKVLFRMLDRNEYRRCITSI